MKKLIDRSYAAIVKRGLITNETKKIDFLCKIEEEFHEVESECFTNEKRYIEELTDLATVCFMQIKNLGYDPVKEFEKVVVKNETRKD